MSDSTDISDETVIQRYTTSRTTVSGMRERDSGSWVKFEDHLAALSAARPHLVTDRGEPVAWRHRYTKMGSNLAWHVTIEKPTGLPEDYAVDPLYVAASDALAPAAGQRKPLLSELLAGHTSHQGEVWPDAPSPAAGQPVEIEAVLKSLQHCVERPMRCIETFPDVCQRAIDLIFALAHLPRDRKGE